MGERLRFDPIAILTLREIRTFIRNSSARGGVVFFALLYALASAFSSGMILIASVPGGYTFTPLWSGGPGTNFWNYPGFLLVAPWGVVSVPFFPTLSMVLVAVGVGYGMTVAFLLSVRLIRNRARTPGGATATATMAGLTPAMITLVTLGACCSTTAAASAGVGLVAQASGTSTTNLLLNNWFLGVFQIVIVWVALLAQELLLIVYSGLFGPSTPGTAVPAPIRLDRRTLAGGAVRVLLLVAGVLWSLSMVAEWTTTSPWTAGAGLWFQWLVQHQLVAGVAIAAALFPSGTWQLLHRARNGPGKWFSALVVLAGVSLVFSPPPLPAWGLDGLVNQALFTLHAPASWGTVSPSGLGGVALALRWTFEYALLGTFAIAAALKPDAVLGRLRWESTSSAPLTPSSAAAGARSTSTDRSGEATLVPGSAERTGIEPLTPPGTAAGDP